MTPKPLISYDIEKGIHYLHASINRAGIVSQGHELDVAKGRFLISIGYLAPYIKNDKYVWINHNKVLVSNMIELLTNEIKIIALPR